MSESIATVEDAPIDASSPSLIEDIASSAVQATLAEQTPAVALPPRDATGKFTKGESEPTEDVAEPMVPLPEGDTSTAAPVDPVESVPTDAEGAEAKLPEGMVAVPKIEGRDLAAQFTVLDAEGELDPPALTIKFVANGKERSEPLDKVVALAQMGVYNHAREQQAQEARATVQRVESEYAQIKQYAEQLQKEREALLSNDDYYLTTRAKFEQENTPQARLERQQAEIEQERELRTIQDAASQANSFYDTAVMPAVDQIAKALPTVSPEEIGAKLLLMLPRYQVQTRFGPLVPPANFDAVKQAIVQDLVPWAQQLHDHRDTDRRAAAQQTAAEKLALTRDAEKARVEAQKKTAMLTRPAKPGQGRVATDTPTPKKLVTVEDNLQDAIASSVKLAMAG